jgi:hypothetical protein
MPDIQTNLEVVAVHGVFEEFYQQWLKHGHLVGVNGGGDNHMPSTGNANPGNHYPNTNGLTGLFAPEASRQGVWHGYKHRKTIAVTGNQRMFVDFTSDAARMGQVVKNDGGPRRFRLFFAGTAPVLKAELLKNNEVVETWRQPADNAAHVRLVWTDNCCSRRTDDTWTTGEISAKGGVLKLMSHLNAYNRTDCVEESGGALAFRSNGYSGATRGVIVAVEGGADAVQFSVDDRVAGHQSLADTIEIPLDDLPASVERPLDTSVVPWFANPVFTNEPVQPTFYLDADLVDIGGTKTAECIWQDDAGDDAWYYVRIEQIDGNIAWSSPIWYREQ